MTDQLVFSESLAYNAVKRRAVSARSFRVKINASNSTTFSPGDTAVVDLPGNLSSQYYNANQMYMLITVTPTVRAVKLDRAGALSLISRTQISSAGANIFDLNHANVLATAVMDADATSEYKAGYGSLMLGTVGDTLAGETLDVGVSRTFAIPMVLNPLALTTPHRLIPAFGLSAIQMRLTFDSIANAFIQVDGQDAVVTYSDVQMVCLMTQLSAGAQAEVDRSTGGFYKILATSFQNATANLAINQTNLTAPLGFSVSSLERILLVHRPSLTVNNALAHSLGNRGSAGMTQFNFAINGESYPQRPINVTASATLTPAEAVAEMLIADHALVDFKKGCSLSNGYAVTKGLGIGQGALSGVDPSSVHAKPFNLPVADGISAGSANASYGELATPSAIGTFLCSVEFESGISDGKSATIYSGISTLASQVQLNATYVSTGSAFDIDAFAQYSIIMALDMRGSGVISVSV